MKINSILSYFFRLIFSVWLLFSFYDGLSVNNWYELTVAYLIAVFPFTLVLFLISIRDTKCTGFKKITGWGGIMISLCTFFAEVIHIMLVYF